MTASLHRQLEILKLTQIRMTMSMPDDSSVIFTEVFFYKQVSSDGNEGSTCVIVALSSAQPYCFSVQF